MKRVQDYLRELDRVKLVDAYLDFAPDGNEGLFSLNEFTVDQGRYIKCRDISKFIQKLVDMEMTQVENGKTYILMAHPGKLVTNEDTDVMHKLVCKEDLLSDDGDKDYWYDTSPHPEILGLYVADTPYTKMHIYELMAQVIYEALEYGFDQEELAEVFDTLSNPASAWYKDQENYIAAVEEKALDKVPVPTDSEVNREEIERLQKRLKAVFAVDEYRRFCYRRELKKLREMLKNEAK